MTGPVTTEALVDQIARILDPDAHHLGLPDYYGPEPILAGASARVRVARKNAGAILAGPLAPLLAALQQVTAERDGARAENDRFRAGLANGSSPCAYCNLSREDWTKCRSGFPGCDRADDAMLCPHFGAEMEANDRADAATSELARLRAEGEAKDRARWLPIATAPTDRPVVVRMKSGFLPSGWFTATVTLPDPDDDSRLGGCTTILNYDGQPLLTRFHGKWTDWLDGGDTALARAATAREGA